MGKEKGLEETLESTFNNLEKARKEQKAELHQEEVGIVRSTGGSVARLSGLDHARYFELISLPDDCFGIAFNLEPEEVSVILLDESDKIRAGARGRRTGEVMSVPVGESLLGRSIDPLGRPLDEKGNVESSERRPIEREAPSIMDRAPVEEPVQTGLQVIDALIPIGRGQRELVLGDRQTGKTAIAVDTIINQKETDMICIYCAIGQRSSSVSQVMADLEKNGVMDSTIVVAATGESTPGMIFSAPYAATTMGEYFMEQGKDVLVVYDDLTRHARAYRELSLILRRPPAREAYPGDIFYVHSRLLERSTHLNEDLGGGSLTALPIIETQAQNISAYIPTNLISITDGQIYLDPGLFQEGLLPAVDVGKSVSRVGGKTQLKPYRDVAGDLRLSYTQFEELESFSRLGTRLDEETEQKLRRGERVRQILRQQQYSPIPVAEQIALLFAVTNGVFDDMEIDRMSEARENIRREIRDSGELYNDISRGKELTDEDREKLLALVERASG
jgi:F-type H+-transporting ATPase subunit alpha